MVLNSNGHEVKDHAKKVAPSTCKTSGKKRAERSGPEKIHLRDFEKDRMETKTREEALEFLWVVRVVFTTMGFLLAYMGFHLNASEAFFGAVVMFFVSAVIAVYEIINIH